MGGCAGGCSADEEESQKRQHALNAGDNQKIAKKKRVWDYHHPIPTANCVLIGVAQGQAGVRRVAAARIPEEYFHYARPGLKWYRAESQPVELTIPVCRVHQSR